MDTEHDLQSTGLEAFNEEMAAGLSAGCPMYEETEHTSAPEQEASDE